MGSVSTPACPFLCPLLRTPVRFRTKLARIVHTPAKRTGTWPNSASGCGLLQIGYKFARSTRFEVPTLEIQRHIHQGDHYRDFDQRTNHRRKGRA